MEKLKPISGNNIIDAKDVKNIINTVLKNWYWFVLFMGITIGLSVFQLYKSTYYYGAEAKILLKPQKNAFKDALDNAIPTGPNDEEVANEIYVAVLKRKRDLLLTTNGKLTVWLNKFFPTLMDKIVFNHMRKEEESPF